MKQNDITLIVVLACLSGIISFVASGMVFGRPSEHAQKVEIVETIDADFPAADPKFFNHNAIDPTRLIQIGDYQNPNPFSGTQ